MKYYFTFLLTCICLMQCTSIKKTQIQGTWMDITPNTAKLHSPVIRFYDNYYVYKSELDPTYESEERVGYTIKGDKICIDEGSTIRFVIENDTLKFFDIETGNLDSYFIRFEKINILHYFNSLHKTHIELPDVGKLERGIDSRFEDNVFHLDYRKDSIVLFYNGNEISLDTLLLENLPDNYLRFNICFFHKVVPYFYVRAIKNKLKQASLFWVKYVTSDEKNILYAIGTHIPSSSHTDLPSLYDKKQKNLLFEIYENKFIVNGEQASLEFLIAILSDEIRMGNTYSCLLYIDDHVSYERYIFILNKIQKTYYAARKEYAKEKYNKEDYHSLDDDIVNEIQKHIPMRFLEIEEHEMRLIRERF